MPPHINAEGTVSMKFSLSPEQANRAIQNYLADPDDEAVVSVRIPDAVPMRLSRARNGNIVVLTGEDIPVVGKPRVSAPK
tara:strand:+ start:6167 stop:6406 length:240 start_codon:yes stop_codon:yes gene_type:complete